MVKTRIIKIEKHIIFGDGDIQSCAFEIREENGIGLSFVQIESGEVGRKTHQLSKEEFDKRSEVYLFFKNKESLDITINNLKIIRKYFEEESEDSHDNKPAI